MSGRGLATLAAVAAVGLGWLLHRTAGFPLVAAATLAAAAAGIAAARAAGPRGALAVALAAVAGQWLALWPLSGGLWWMGAPSALFPWPGWVGAFVAFRALALWRPAPVARAGGPRVSPVAEDLAAGALAGVAVAAAAAVAHGALR